MELKQALIMHAKGIKFWVELLDQLHHTFVTRWITTQRSVSSDLLTGHLTAKAVSIGLEATALASQHKLDVKNISASSPPALSHWKNENKKMHPKLNLKSNEIADQSIHLVNRIKKT
eukprot:928288_1